MFQSSRAWLGLDSCSAMGGLVNGYGGFVMLGHAINVTKGSRQAVREVWITTLYEAGRMKFCPLANST